MDDSLSGCVSMLIIAVVFCAAVVFIAYVAAIAASFVGAAGVAYGGGLACRNYALSFKRNIIDSNSK